MKAHILGTEVIHAGTNYEAKLSNVSLRRAILNQCTPFMAELENSSVEIKFCFQDDCMVDVDKNMFSLVMYNFFSNAAKYVKAGSQIRLHFSDDLKNLDISMISLKMDRDEISSLFLEGVRGKHATDINGKGIGLFVLQNALNVMGKQPMYIYPNYEISINEGNKIYNENHFIINLK
jgi:signal transduction histidine kinase